MSPTEPQPVITTVPSFLTQPDTLFTTTNFTVLAITATKRFPATEFCPSGLLRKQKGEQNFGEIGFDVSGKWAYVSGFDNKTTLLRVQSGGSLKALPAQSQPAFVQIRLLNTSHQIAVLEGGLELQTQLSFARISPTGSLTVFSRLVLPNRPEIRALQSLRPPFLLAALDQKSISSLVVINTGDKTHLAKTTQTIPLGGDIVQSIAVYAPHKSFSNSKIKGNGN